MSNPEDPGAIDGRRRPDRIKPEAIKPEAIKPEGIKPEAIKPGASRLPGGPNGPDLSARPAEPPGPGALRLIYEYENGEVTLVSQQRVDVAVPGFDLPEGALGDHVEVRDRDGRALTRVAVRNAAPESVEVFGEPGEAITRVPDPIGKGAFTVIVPAGADAARVVLQRPRFTVPPVGGLRIAPAPTPGGQADEGHIVLSDDAIEG